MVKIEHDKMRHDLYIAHLGSYLSNPFGTMREYFDSVQVLLNDEKKRTLDLMGRETAKRSQEENGQVYEWYSEEYERLEDLFPCVLRNSLFVAIYTELEDKLKFICSSLENEKKCTIPVHKWRGGILERAKESFEKEICITWTVSPGLWNEILKTRQIRNILVHNGGWLNGTKNKDDSETQDTILLKYIHDERKPINLFEKDGFYKLQLTNPFIHEAMNLFEKFLHEVFESISHQVKGRKHGVQYP